MFVAAIGATVLFQYASGIDLGIDSLFLFGRTWGNSRVLVPGRMGPPGAISWTMIGLAIVLASIRSRPWPRAAAPMIALVATAIAMLSADRLSLRCQRALHGAVDHDHRAADIHVHPRDVDRRGAQHPRARATTAARGRNRRRCADAAGASRCHRRADRPGHVSSVG